MKQLTLDLQFFAGEKTEKATPKKRRDTRKKGQVAKSQDLNSAVIFFLVFLFLQFFSAYVIDGAINIFRHSFDESILMTVTVDSIHLIFIDIFIELLYLIGPIMLVALIAGIGGNFLQVGFMVTPEPLTPKLERLDPVKGFKRIFSIRAIVELLKSILKISFVGIVTFSILWSNIDQVLMLSQKTVWDTLKTVVELVLKMGVAASLSLLFLALLDYLYQRYDFEKNIRMSKQDIKDELKNTEGDPLIRSRIKQKQREMAMSRMMQEVPKADVVITNPTHYAVALKYDEEKDDAPVVIAKGVDFIAQKIRAVAEENEIVIVENRPLARALYEELDIGDQIPEQFFKAVAEILAYVYRIKNKI